MRIGSQHRRTRLGITVGGATIALVVLGLGTPLPSQADTQPHPGTPATVSADSLPTWQVNGVVWSQVVVGNTVYATGSFTAARPPGVAVGGAGSVPANNIFAYNVTTGSRVTTFSHSLNAQGLALAASPDGTRVYVAGDFTTVDGLNRGHIAAFSTADGSLLSSFAPSLGGSAGAIAVSPSTVYVGGNFSSARGVTRKHLAAFSPANGALLPWAPSADNGKVSAMAMAPDNSRVIVGGMFTTLNGQSANGMGSLDATSGGNLPWAANQTIRDGGSKSGITSLRSDGRQIYGSGYAFGTGNFEGSFAANPLTGAIVVANDCHGDTYDVFPVGQDLYTVSHAHDCSWIRSFPESSPRSINMRHALGFTTYPTTTNKGPDNYGWNYNGVPASALLQWFPVVAIGSYTGQSQAAWSVSGNSSYVVLGGEFPSVNGTAQQGLARFSVASLAPNKRGPVMASGATTSATAAGAGTVKVAWRAAYDMDNTTLRYDVFRSGTTNPVYTTSLDSNFWTTPAMSFTDTGLLPGASYTYTIKATDPFGNVLTMPKTNTVTVTQPLAVQNKAGPVATTPDQTTPDQTTPDQTTPDQTPPLQTTPDQPPPLQTTPDQPPPDQTTTPDQQTTPDLTAPTR